MKALLVLLRSVSRHELASRPVRSVLMIGTVAVGVALLTAMHVATESIVTGFAGDLERLGGKTDLQVTFGTGETGFSEEIVERIKRLPVVDQAAALVHSQVTFADGEPETVELFGIDLMQPEILELFEVEVIEREPGDFVLLDDPRGIYVTDVIARERGLSLGSKTRLSAVDGVHDYTVHGIVASKGLAGFLGGRLIAMFLPASQPVAGRKGDLTTSMVDQIDVQLRQGVSVESARVALQSQLGPGFVIGTPMQRRIAGQHTVNGLRATLVGMSSLALLASIFIIYASTTTMVVERLSAMATLITIGASPSVLVRSIVLEAALLGTIGSVAGVALGLLLSGFIGEDVAAGMGLNYSLPFDSARNAFDPWTVFIVHPLGGVFTASASAWLPARRMRHITPIVLQRADDALMYRAMISLPTAVVVAAIPGVVGALALGFGVARGSVELVSLGGMAIVGSAVLAMLPLLRIAWSLLVPVMTRLSGISGKLAAENLLRSLDRSLVTASAITLSVAVAVGAASLVKSFRDSVSGWYGFSGDALVSSRAVTGGWMAAPIRSELEPALRALPSVESVETLRVLQGQPYRDERIAIAALSDGLVREALRQSTMVSLDSEDAAATAVIEGRGVAVSQNFESRFGIPGSDTLLSVTTTSGTIQLPVVAIVPDYVSDKGSVLVAQELLERHWNDHLVNYFAIRLSNGASVQEVARDLERSLPGEALVVTPTERMIERVDGLIGQAFADIDTIKLLVLFLTVVGIADLVVSNVLSRRRELAVLRIVGLTDAQVARVSRLESLCIGVSAGLCGAAVGALCAWLWVHYNYPALVGYVLELHIAWSGALVALLMATASAWVAATLAARYALRQPALFTVRVD